MDGIKTLLAMENKSQVLLILILVIVATVFIIENIQKLKILFGIKTKWDTREEREEKAIEELEHQVLEIKNEVDSMKKTIDIEHSKRKDFEQRVISSLDKIEYQMKEDKIQRLRSEILDFCNACRIRDYSKESYDNILSLYDEYELLIKSMDKTNGKAEMGIKFIREKYANYMKDGFPTY